MKLLNYKELGTTIRTVFIEVDKYKFDKYVPAFEYNGTFIGDFFNYIMLEFRPEKAPIFYHVFSPYDVVSNKSSQHAVVLQSAEVLFSAEVTQFVYQRTGVMTPLVLRSIGVRELKDKNVLCIGTGRIARCALMALKEYYPEVARVDFINSGTEAAEFSALASSLEVETHRGDLKDIGAYDVIMCHSSAKRPLLSPEVLKRIKHGAFISAFASEDHMDVSEDYYDTTKARVIVDWDQTLTEAPELNDAINKGLANKQEIHRLKDVFAGGVSQKTDKAYTIYRSHGTPMQNLAFLQLLMKGEQ